MGNGVLFLLAPLGLAVFGLPAAFARPVDRFSTWGRLSAAFLTGTVAFTVWLTLLSAAGVRWSPLSVVVPLGLASVALAAIASRRRSGEAQFVERPRPRISLVSDLAVAMGTAHLILTALLSRATSIDYLFFWGLKAQRFVEAGGIDASLLADPLSVHLHSNYPPLLPLVSGWGIAIAGELPWQMGLASYAIWLLAGAGLLRDLLALRLGSNEAALVASFWFLAFALALPVSLSAGNAEAPLLFFSSVAVAALLAETRDERRATTRWLAAIALAGVVLTKNEGAIVFALIATGAIAGDVVNGLRGARLARRASTIVLVPLCALGSWLAFEALRGVPMRDVTREQAGNLSLGSVGKVSLEFLSNLDAGSWWFAWGLAGMLLVKSWKQWRRLLPAMVPALGILLFLFVYYLHYQGNNLDLWMRWTMPRVSLSALGAVILGAAFTTADSQAAP